MSNYITNEDTIIFMPHYDELIDINLLSQYNKIIFSDYELSEELFEKYENFYLNLPYINYHFFQKVKGLRYFGCKFDQEVELPKNLIHLTFGYHFNQKVELPENLTHLTFGDNFNQKVELPENITHLTFGFCFNQKVELPKNLTHLTFGKHFKLPQYE